MQNEVDIKEVNTNPLAFEELATSLASLTDYIRQGKGDMSYPIKEFERLFTQALQQPASYTEINELTGQSLSSGDRRAGRGAWLLMNIENLDVSALYIHYCGTTRAECIRFRYSTKWQQLSIHRQSLMKMTCRC